MIPQSSNPWGASISPRFVYSANLKTSKTSDTATGMHGREKENGKIADPWEVCGEFAKKYADEENASWKEEVDKLLVFASLFSGVVTAFALESYHAVQEDPAATTALLLRTIIRQLDNITNPQPGTLIDLNPRANVPQSARWINTCWFLSLTLSLSTVMAGILCLQWMREYSQSANIPHREHLAIRYVRYEGMKKWQVSNIVSALPILLLTALLFFLVGLIGILWNTDKGAAVAVSALVGIAFLFILTTTILPWCQSLWIIYSPHTQSPQCPYKSPQARIFYILAMLLYRPIGNLVSRCFRVGEKGRVLDPKLRTWLDYDWLLFNHRQAAGVPEAADVGRGLGWIGTTFFQYDRLAEAICQCLRDLDYHVVLEAFLAQMDGDRAEAVRRAQRRLGLPHSPGDSEEPQPSKIVYMQDLIISHTLEHLAAGVERGHMSQVLLSQRVNLFLKINGKSWTMDQDIDCPVNKVNVALIDLDKSSELFHLSFQLIFADTRLRILRCIYEMMRMNMECNATHTTGAFEIIRSICIEHSDPHQPLPHVQIFLELLRWWIPNQPLVNGEHRFDPDPEKRLKQGVLFCKLRLVSRGTPYETIIRDYRARLEILIRERLGRELERIQGVTGKPSSFPYLAKYLAWRQFDY